MSRLYPASPAAPPSSLTQPAPGYVARALILLLGLAAFVALYLGLGVALLALLREIWSLELRGRAAVAVIGGGTVAVLALLAFLVKGLFFRERTSRDGFIEVTAETQPKLFEFIEQLVAETGAPRPRKVYLTPDVNAAVFYEPSLLSLVWPTPKSLIIGLGLVNQLTLSELKAVLGHELGHFSQRSMKLGTYAYTAQRVVANLVYGRDAFDELLDAGKRADVRIALLAYVVAGLVWVLRAVLRLAFYLIALGQRALSREMEFAADRMAVSVAGSDAIARALYKLEFADACFGASLSRLTHAADQGLVTDDFYFHQTGAGEEVRRFAKRPRWGDPDDRVDGFLFAHDATSQPSMWATHPPSSERERAARTHCVECEHDERSAWLLFDDAAGLRAQATIALMRSHVPHAKAFPKPAAEVEASLEHERRAAAIVASRGAMYTGRELARLDLDALFTRTPRPREALEAAHAGLYGAEVEALNEKFESTQKTLQLLGRAQAGALRADALVVDGSQRAFAEVPELIEGRVELLKQLDREYERHDHRIAEVHAEIAIAIGPQATKRLRRAYAAPLRYGQWLRALRAAQDGVSPFLAAVNKGQELDQHAVHTMIARLEDVRAETARIVTAARDRRAPAYLELGEGAKLGAFLLPRRGAGVWDGANLGAWLGQVLGDSSEVVDKLQRLHQRAIAKLLELHEELAGAWSRGEVEPVTEAGVEPSAASGDDAAPDALEA